MNLPGAIEAFWAWVPKVLSIPFALSLGTTRVTGLSVTTPDAKLATMSPLWSKPRAGPLPYGADFALVAAAILPPSRD